MNDDSTSLDRLHDVVVPPPVSWWPLAPGWYVLAAGLIVLAAAIAFWRWRRWRTNAYRREALQELRQAHTAESVSEVLKRTALVIASRRELAQLSGASWPDWLDAQIETPMPGPAKSILAEGIYRDSAPPEELKLLKAYAAKWISGHRLDPNSNRDSP